MHSTREGKLWNEFVARFHYLGHKTLVGAQMRYSVRDCDGWPLAMLGFSTAAWMLAPRDVFIGWTPDFISFHIPFQLRNGRVSVAPVSRAPPPRP